MERECKPLVRERPPSHTACRTQPPPDAPPTLLLSSHARRAVALSAPAGVCHADARTAWGLDVEMGSTIRMSLDAKGELQRGDAPPKGYPAGRGGVAMASKPVAEKKEMEEEEEDELLLVLPEEDKEEPQEGNDDTMCAATAEGNGTCEDADGTVTIEVRVDHDAGTVGFRRRGGATELQEVEIHGFPKGAPLRPWASCCYLGDEVVFATPFVQTCSSASRA